MHTYIFALCALLGRTELRGLFESNSSVGVRGSEIQTTGHPPCRSAALVVAVCAQDGEGAEHGFSR